MRSTKEVVTLSLVIVAISYPFALAMRTFALEPKQFDEPNLGILAWPFFAFSLMIWFVKLNATRRFCSSTMNLLSTMTLVSAILTIPAAGLILLGLCVALDLGVDSNDGVAASDLFCVVQSLGGIVGIIVAFT